MYVSGTTHVLRRKSEVKEILVKRSSVPSSIKKWTYFSTDYFANTLVVFLSAKTIFARMVDKNWYKCVYIGFSLLWPIKQVFVRTVFIMIKTCQPWHVDCTSWPQDWSRTVQHTQWPCGQAARPFNQQTNLAVHMGTLTSLLTTDFHEQMKPDSGETTAQDVLTLEVWQQRLTTVEATMCFYYLHVWQACAQLTHVAAEHLQCRILTSTPKRFGCTCNITAGMKPDNNIKGLWDSWQVKPKN